MKRPPLILLLVLAACAHAPDEGAKRAAVETRQIPVRPRVALQKTRVAEAQSDAGLQGDPQQVIERQSRRIADLEAHAAPDPEARQVLELVSYSQRIAGLKSEEQAHELALANQAFERDPQAYSRLKLALLLSAPGTSFTDESRAAALLEPLASGTAKGPLRQFASLVHGQVSERLREQKRVAQLKEQLDGLRAIDRSMIERDPGRAP